MASSPPAAVLTVDGRRVRLTSLDKVMYPERGTTKRDVIAYYLAVAPYLVAHAAWRPATRKRWVHGVGTAAEPGEVFFQKNLDGSTPAWVPRFGIQHSDRMVSYPMLNDAASVVHFAQMGALELHTPQWRFDAKGRPRNPDRLVLDLDPGPGADLPQCVELALLCRELLQDVGLRAVPVTSGSKGIHLYAALDGSMSSDAASAFAQELAKSLEADHPKLVVSDMKKSLRGGKVLLDWSQNNGAKTTIAPYSLRGRLAPMVAAPRSWDELTEDLEHLDYEQVLERLATIGDPMAWMGDDPVEPVVDTGPASTQAAASGVPVSIAGGSAPKVAAPRKPGGKAKPVAQASPAGNEKPAGKAKPAEKVKQVEKAVAGKKATSARAPSTARSEPEPEPGAGSGAQTDVEPPGHDADEPTRVARPKAAKPTGRPRLKLIQGGASEAPAPRLSHGYQPMLATPGTVAGVRGSGWTYEVKWDGYRALVQVDEAGVRLTSRNGIDLTDDFPELQELAGLTNARSAVLDGEIVALDDAGRPSFELLQQRAQHGERARIVLVLFDVLRIDDRPVIEQSYADRRELLEDLVDDGEHVQVPLSLDDDLEEALALSRMLKLEGIMAKRTDSVYRPGTRTPHWIKIKHTASQTVVIIGWSPGKGNRSGSIGSLLLAVPDGDRLTYVGRVGSGFSDRQLRAARDKLGPLEVSEPPAPDVPRADARGVHWVRPELVAEVTYGERTSSGRLRHPVWKGWRPDKAVDDVARE